VALLLVVCGGLLVAGGSLLPWETVGIDAAGIAAEAQLRGLDSGYGRLALPLALVAIVLALLQSGALLRRASWLVVAAALVAVFKAWRFAGELGLAATNSGAAVDISLGAGFWLIVLRGLVAFASRFAGTSKQG
jgi:hypothetical protein